MEKQNYLLHSDGLVGRIILSFCFKKKIVIIVKLFAIHTINSKLITICLVILYLYFQNMIST